jgi:thiosulfate reductase cytochrome b subunit
MIRGAHWINVLCVAILLMSGLQIFNAHPALYWGDDSDFDRPILSIYAGWNAEGDPVGVTAVLGRTFETTGLLGWSRVDGRPAQRAFPSWMTIPAGQDLATGRIWHFFFAWVFVLNGILYVGYSVISRHIGRDLLPQRSQWQQVVSSIWQHLTLRLRSARSAEYNLVQKVTYLSVIFVLAPFALLTGLTMSPAIDAAAPWLLDLFGGRQSARMIHFAASVLFVLFTLVHVTMIVLSGFFNHMRSMVTGWYARGAGPDEAR